MASVGRTMKVPTFHSDEYRITEAIIDL